MREQRFPWGPGAILVLVIVGGIGFWLGSSSVAPVIVPVAAPVAPAPVTPVVPTYPAYPPYAVPHGGGFPIFGLIFGLIVLAVIFKIARRAMWAGATGGPGWGGPNGSAWGRHPRHRGASRRWSNDDLDNPASGSPPTVSV